MQTGKVHDTKICTVFLALMSHRKAHDLDLFARFAANHRCTSEEEIELFHSSIAHYTYRRITAKRLAERINVHAAYRGSKLWCVGDRNQGEKICGRDVRGALWRGSSGNGMRDTEALRDSDQFTGTMHTGYGQTGVELTDLWQFSDRMLPIPLQQNPDAIGLNCINLRQWKVCTGVQLTPRRHFECGHPRRREAVCSQCLHITTHIAHEVLIRFERDVVHKKL